MTSKYQKNQFPIKKMARMQSLLVLAPGWNAVDISYSDLKLEVINGQLCWTYDSEDGDLIMPIARLSTIKDLEDKSNG